MWPCGMTAARWGSHNFPWNKAPLKELIASSSDKVLAPLITGSEVVCSHSQLSPYSVARCLACVTKNVTAITKRRFVPGAPAVWGPKVGRGCADIRVRAPMAISPRLRTN